MTAEEGRAPEFPPMMWGEDATGDAFGHAARRAALGCESGLITYRLAADRMEAALVLAPEVPLAQAMIMLPLCGVGFQNALGALAPPEVAVHLEWDGRLRVNGALCGALAAMASAPDPVAVPDWLVVGVALDLLPASAETGNDPDRTALFVEGCAEVSPVALLEAWARHTLNWLARWESEGNAPLHAEWRGLAWGMGESASLNGLTGTFMGIDEDFGMLLRNGETTHLIPLTNLLRTTA